MGTPGSLELEGPLSVLLIENNLGDARLFAKHLEESPVEAILHHRETLEAGLSVLRANSLNVLVLDLRLPDGRGPETVRKSATTAPQVPIVVLTGKEGLEAAMRAQEAGATEYLRKEELTPNLVGRTLLWAARHSKMETRLQGRTARLEGVAESLLGVVFRLTSSSEESADTPSGGTFQMHLIGDTDGKVLGIEAERENCFRPFVERIPSPHRARFLESAEEAVRQETTLGVDFPFEHPGTGRVWLRASASPEHQGRELVLSGVILNVTDRQERKRRYEAIFNQTYQFIGLMEPDGTLIEANDTALQFGGLDRQDVIGKPFWETYWWQVDEKTRRDVRQAIERAAEGEFVRYDVEVQGGEQNVMIDFSIRPVTDKDGKVTLLIPEGRNITELKALKERERKLERTRDLLTQAQRMANVGGWKIDVRGDPPYVPEWTDEVYAIFDLPPEEDWPLEEILQHLPPEAREERRKALDRAIESGVGWDQESRMVTAKTNERWIRSIGTAVVEEGEVTALQGAFQDITGRKRRERQLERQNERLDQFASLVSHDLRNPLNVAQGRLALAREHVPSENDAPGHLKAVGRALNRMNAIIKDLLTLTWGRQDLDPVEVETFSLEDVAMASWEHVDTPRATLQVDADANLRADVNRLHRLLENLFRNAVEHGGRAVTVTVGPLPGGFYVEDDGRGIPLEKQAKVLEAGYSSGEEGTGLGLSIVTSIVEVHGWDLAVTQGNDSGARFEITGAREGAGSEESP